MSVEIKKTGTGRGRGKKPDMSSEALKLMIVDIARKHFALHGYQGASLKAIAEEAGVANSLINYHFTDRKRLFSSCMIPFLRSRMEGVQRILGEPHNREELKVRIELFVEEMLAAVLADPHGFDILNREVKAGNLEILEIFEETVLTALKAVVAFFERAKVNGLIREDSNPLILAALLFSATCDASRKDVIARRFFNRSLDEPEFRKDFVQHVVSLFMSGVAK